MLRKSNAIQTIRYFSKISVGKKYIWNVRDLIKISRQLSRLLKITYNSFWIEYPCLIHIWTLFLNSRMKMYVLSKKIETPYEYEKKKSWKSTSCIFNQTLFDYFETPHDSQEAFRLNYGFSSFLWFIFNESETPENFFSYLKTLDTETYNLIFLFSKLKQILRVYK